MALSPGPCEDLSGGIPVLRLRYESTLDSNSTSSNLDPGFLERVSKICLNTPFTFKGAVYYAGRIKHQVFRHLVGWSLLCAVLLTISLGIAWVPTISKALEQLPTDCSFQDGNLVWPGSNPTVLAANSFLSLIVNPTDTPTVDHSTDLQIEFGQRELRLRSFLGWMTLPYMRTWHGATGRAHALAWWGAWKPTVFILAVVAWAFSLIITWITLASLYAFPASLMLGIAGKFQSYWDAWRLMLVALLPGSFILSGAVCLYSISRISLLFLSMIWVVHVVIGWIYGLGSIVRSERPMVPENLNTPNPFQGASSQNSLVQGASPNDNPFTLKTSSISGDTKQNPTNRPEAGDSDTTE